MVTLDLSPTPPPLVLREGGAYTVGESRVVLDVLLQEFNRGSNPNEIVAAFPTLQLADVYAVCGFYLSHKAEVDRYLKARRKAADEFRREMEQRFPPDGLWERLKKRADERGIAGG